MYNNLSAIFYILGASGYITYLSKYMEVQFQESAIYTVITGKLTIHIYILIYFIILFLPFIHKLDDINIYVHMYTHIHIYFFLILPPFI